MIAGGPTAQIIERKGWKCDKDFVGHRKAVNCVVSCELIQVNYFKPITFNTWNILITFYCFQRFNQAILRQKDAPKKKQYCCLAIGSRDRSISVWCTKNQRPLFVIQDLFNDSVLDLSWSQIKDQTILLGCSTDGTIAALVLSEDELGTSLSAEEKVNFMNEKLISIL